MAAIPDPLSVLVGGLSGIDEETVSQYFQELGNVTALQQSENFAHVTFADKEDVRNMLVKRIHTIGGQKVTIEASTL